MYCSSVRIPECPWSKYKFLFKWCYCSLHWKFCDTIKCINHRHYYVCRCCLNWMRDGRKRGRDGRTEEFYLQKAVCALYYRVTCQYLLKIDYLGSWQQWRWTSFRSPLCEISLRRGLGVDWQHLDSTVDNIDFGPSQQCIWHHDWGIQNAVNNKWKTRGDRGCW